MILFLFIAAGCSSSSSEERLKEELNTSFSNSLYEIEFEKLEESRYEGKDGFFLHYSITSPDESRELSPSDIDMTFSKVIEDEFGNEHSIYQETEMKTDQEENNVLRIKQFFTTSLHHDSEQLISTAQLVLHPNKTVRFDQVKKDKIPISRDELTIQDMEWNDNKLTLTATDVLDIQNVEWSILSEGEQIYPVFTNSITEEEHYFKGEFEFAVELEEPFTIIAERSDSSELIWELPFVIPID
ncbi:hypothetical protein [Alteribacillus sp. YIM 98480]|uniref:hypothetical protein n=1 Tax=Alteribacillus sp. YIM 98480 TaxID=2606599 RepID=UPI00131CE707|nr:hypothetical protein [Alteribacillus sp. YIM 98480]